MALDLKERIEVWKQYETVAMHFNDVILKVRIQALGGVTAVITVAGLAGNWSKSAVSDPWWLLVGIIGFLLVAWLAIALLDVLYYHPLLVGAVDALLEIEADSKGDIILSTRIAHAVNPKQPKCCRWLYYSRHQLLFYGLGAIALVFGLVFSWNHTGTQSNTGGQGTSQLPVTVTLNGGLQLKTEHTVPGGVQLNATHSIPSKIEVKADHVISTPIQVKTESTGTAAPPK